MPLNGSFIINCVKSDGSSVPTVEIPVYYSTSTIKDKIVDACPEYRDKL